MAQHVSDVIAFIEQLDPKPVDLMGHSRGGHIAFRVAQQRPDLLRKVVLAEPGGDLDQTLDPSVKPGAPSVLSARTLKSVKMVREGDIDGALQNFVDGIDGEHAWRRLPAAAKQQLRDNIITLLGQVHEARKPYSLADVNAIKTPTLLLGGAETTGSLSTNWRELAKHLAGARTAEIAGGRHWMFEHDPKGFCRVVMEFLEG